MAGTCGIQLINLCLLFFMVSLKIDNAFLNYFGLFNGTYLEITAGWFIEFGSMIVQTMIIEIAVPHLFPLIIWAVVGIMRCCDRRCRCDQRKSKKILQDDYEELYVGTEFVMDSRMAQILAIIWATFMFSPALPLLYPIAVVNLTNIYWLDKLQVLRFNRIPKNFDEGLVIKLLNYAKLTFPIHFVTGCILLSNQKILASVEVKESPFVEDVNTWSKDIFGHRILTHKL